MESFYGGRQGASFVIKKKYDLLYGEKEKESLNVPDYVKYRACYYKYNLEEKAFILTKDTKGKYQLIKQNENLSNAYDITNQEEWKAILCNGDSLYKLQNEKKYKFGYYDDDNTNKFTLLVISEDMANISFVNPEEESKGMVDEFSAGRSTADEVNYGEYVIISNANKNYPYNGYVYRRGLNSNEELGGAIFVGSIVGPQGNAPEIRFVDYDSLIDGKISDAAPKMIPGEQQYDEVNEQGEVIKEGHYNQIKVKYNTNKDELNNVNNYDIALQIPYNEFSFLGFELPYYKFNGKRTELAISHDLQEDNLFYSSYVISIPQAVPGNDAYEIIKLKGYIKAKSPYYTNKECTNQKGVLEQEHLIVDIIDYDIKNQQEYHQIEISGNKYWVKQEHCYKDVLYFGIKKYTKDDDNDLGNLYYYRIGDYNIISDINVDPKTGKLIIKYTCKDDYVKTLSWVKDLKLNEQGLVTAHFTTGEQIDLNKNYPLKWIEETVIVDAEGLEKIIEDKGESLITGMPEIGDVLVRYNTTIESNLKDSYYYPISTDNSVKRVWNKVGFAQNLTGLKIFTTAENINQIDENTANAIPAGWGVFIPIKKDSTTGLYEPAYVAIKNGYGADYNDVSKWPKVKISDLGVQTPELIDPTNYATGVQNLEQELLFGKDTYIEEYSENGNKIIVTHYCNDDTLYLKGEKYYKIKTIFYPEGSTQPTIRVENNTLIGVKTDPKWIQYDNNTLFITTGKNYNIVNGDLNIASETTIKTDILYLVTVGVEEKEIIRKETIEQELPNGRKIIKEINTISSKKGDK